MTKWQCNSCGGTYSDANGYYHVCPPQKITPATFDASGKQLTEEKREPRQDVRDERIPEGVSFIDALCFTEQRDPTRNQSVILLPCDSLIRSEGKGRTRIEPV